MSYDNSKLTYPDFTKLIGTDSNLLLKPEYCTLFYFLASIGGWYGVFMGMSMFSLFEICIFSYKAFYYLIVDLF